MAGTVVTDMTSLAVANVIFIMHYAQSFKNRDFLTQFYMIILSKEK